MKQPSERTSTLTAPDGVGRRIVHNTALLSVGYVVNLVAMTLWTILVARSIGPSTYGFYSYAQATLGVLAIFVSLGLDDLLTRDVAQRPDDGPRYLVTFTGIRLGLAAIIFGGYLGFVALPASPGDRGEIFILVSGIWLGTVLISLATAVIKAHQVMRYVVIAQAVNGALTLGSGALAIWTGRPFVVVLGLSLAATLLQTALLYYFAVKQSRAPGPRAAWGVLPRRAVLALLGPSISFALISLIAVLNSNVVILLLRLLKADDQSIGYFAAAQRIYLTSLILPEMLLQSLVPAFSSVFARSPERFPALFDRAYRYLYFLSVPMALGMWVIAPNVLTLIYGPSFAPASGTLRILSLILVTSIGYVVGPAMVAMNRQRLLSVVFGGSVVAVAAAGWWAIPRYGAEGAAWAVVIGSFVSAVVYSVLLFRWLRLAYPVAWVVKTVVASVLMAVAAQLLIARIHFLIVSLLIGPALYVALHLALGTLAPSDWANVRDALPGPIRRALSSVAPGPWRGDWAVDRADD